MESTEPIGVVIVDDVFDPELTTEPSFTSVNVIVQKEVFLYDSVIWSVITFCSFVSALSTNSAQVISPFNMGDHTGVFMLITILFVPLWYAFLLGLQWTKKHHQHITYFKCIFFSLFIMSMVLFFLSACATTLSVCMLQIATGSWASAVAVMLLHVRQSTSQGEMSILGLRLCIFLVALIGWSSGLFHGSISLPMIASFIVTLFIAFHRYVTIVWYREVTASRYTINEGVLALIDYYTLFLGENILSIIQRCRKPNSEVQLLSPEMQYTNIVL